MIEVISKLYHILLEAESRNTWIPNQIGCQFDLTVNLFGLYCPAANVIWTRCVCDCLKSHGRVINVSKSIKLSCLKEEIKEGDFPNMPAFSISRFEWNYDAFIVQSQHNLIRRAVKRILFEFSEESYSKIGLPLNPKQILGVGDYAIFREHAPICPSVVIAIHLGSASWCILCGTECGASKCDDLLALKCARLEFQNLMILRDALCVGSESDEVVIPSDWRKSLILREADSASIIDEITRRCFS